MPEKPNLTVAYRIYPKISKIPSIFANDKLKMSELCLKSFVNACKGVEVKIYVLLDACPNEYYELFNKTLSGMNYELIPLEGIGNQKSFGKQLDLLLKSSFSDFVFFAEDDYFYLPGAFSEMLEFLKANPEADFVTPYDHLDYYTLKFHNYKSRIKFYGKRHWRTVSTTCMTFMARRESLKKSEYIFRSYTKNNADASLWITITKYRVLNILLFIQFILHNGDMCKIYLKSWFYTPLHNIFFPKMRLYSPIPTVATHLDNRYLAPSIDWEEEFGKKL